MRKKGTKIRANIPFSGMAFYHPEERREDFSLIIDRREEDSSGRLLWGSPDFIVPTFLYQRESGYFEWKTKLKNGAPGLSFRISPDWREFVLYEDCTETTGERAFHEFGILFSYAVLNRKAAVFHGVVMEYEENGILVMAPAGTGKTTHTRMWRDRENALILNGDRCLCRNVSGKWYAYGMPWSGSSGEYINRRVPVSVIVALKQGDSDYVRRLNRFESTLYLMQRIFAPFWRGRQQDRAFDICDNLAKEIPVLELHCRPAQESVEVLKREILNLRDENEKSILK